MQIDDDGSGYIDVKELGSALETVGIKLPGYEVRNIMDKKDKNKDDKIDIAEFKEVGALKFYFDPVSICKL